MFQGFISFDEWLKFFYADICEKARLLGPAVPVASVVTMSRPRNDSVTVTTIAATPTKSIVGGSVTLPMTPRGVVQSMTPRASVVTPTSKGGSMVVPQMAAALTPTTKGG